MYLGGPGNGQITASFREKPQFPFSRLRLGFFGGPRAALLTPPACGIYTTTSLLTPWSAPESGPPATPQSHFEVRSGCATGSFDPGFVAGTVTPNAGKFSAFTMNIARNDREQYIKGVQVHTPPGLLGMLSSVPLCGEPQADLGTCPTASRIGTMTVAAGAGPHPFYERGSLYLTGPYRGSPFGLSIVVPTTAGPFNLSGTTGKGTVVVRSTINVDPSTAALTVTSDPLPEVIDGFRCRSKRGCGHQPSGVHVQPNELRCTANQRDDPWRTRRDRERVEPVRGRWLQGPGVQAEVQGLDLGSYESCKWSKSRCEIELSEQFNG